MRTTIPGDENTGGDPEYKILFTVIFVILIMLLTVIFVILIMLLTVIFVILIILLTVIFVILIIIAHLETVLDVWDLNSPSSLTV